MSRSVSGRRTRAIAALLVSTALLSTVFTTFIPGGSTAAADTAGNLVVTRASTPYQTDVAPNGPLTDLKDGDVVTVTATATGLGTPPANDVIYGMDARLCRSGVNIQLTAQFNASGGNCIALPLSPLSSSIVQRTYGPPNLQGTIPFIVGTGTESFHSGPGDPITCDYNNPCALWLRQYVPTGVIPSGNAFVHYDLHFAPPANLPAAPTAVTATAGDAQATVSWTASATTDPAITGYTVTSSPGGQTCSTGAGTSCVVSGLTNGTPYTFTVTATNANGASLASAPSASVTPQSSATVPGAPTAVTATASTTQASVSWTAPASNGGSPITGYTVTSSPGNRTCSTIAATSCTVTGLTRGRTYTFTATATNAVGAGAVSAPSSPVTIPFTDVPPANVFYADITWLAQSGITTGNADGSFNPTGGVKRSAVAAFLYRFEGSPLGAKPICSVRPFTDVPIDHAFCGEIAWMKAEGHSTGNADGTYRPQQDMNRQGMAAFLYRFAGSERGAKPLCAARPFTDVATDHTFCGEIEWLADTGITTGYSDGTFRPGGIVLRQAVARYLHQMSGS